MLEYGTMSFSTGLQKLEFLCSRGAQPSLSVLLLLLWLCFWIRGVRAEGFAFTV